MTIDVNLTFVLLLLTLSLLVGLAFVSWWWRDKYAAELFGFLQLLSAFWVTLALIGLQLPKGPLRVRLWGLNTAMSLVVVIVWLVFILRFSGYDAAFRRNKLVVASIPLFLGSVWYTVNPTWGPFVDEISQATITAGTVVTISIGWAGELLGYYVYVIFAVGLLLVIKQALSGKSIFIGQALALVLGTVITVLASVLSVIGVPVPGYPTTEVALGAQSIFWGYAMFGDELLRRIPSNPSIGRRVIFNHLDVGAIVIGNDGTVLQLNQSAENHVQGTVQEGGPVGPLLDRMGVSTLDELPTRFQSDGQTLRAKRSHITDWRGSVIGQTVIIDDITSVSRQKQGLKVLNRIFRHNLRNDMNVVLGKAEMLQGRDNETVSTIGEEIVEKSADIIAISEKAIKLEDIFESSSEKTQIDFEMVIDGIVSGVLADFPDATISTDISVAEFETDPQVLSMVLGEVITNAIHHSGTAPNVDIRGYREGDAIKLVVSDDGPGIPKAEYEPIFAGEETELDHASSLGLWLVYWGTQSLGGELNISSTATGTTVTVTLPGA